MKKEFVSISIVILLVIFVLTVFREPTDNLTGIEEDLSFEELIRENESLTKNLSRLEEKNETLEFFAYKDLVEAIDTVETYKLSESFLESQSFFTNDVEFSKGEKHPTISFENSMIEWLPNSELQLKLEQIAIKEGTLFLVYRSVLETEYNFYHQFVLIDEGNWKIKRINWFEEELSDI